MDESGRFMLVKQHDPSSPMTSHDFFWVEDEKIWMIMLFMIYYGYVMICPRNTSARMGIWLPSGELT